MIIRALLIEDQRPEVFADVLSNYNGFEWAIARDGRQAIDLAMGQEFDIILVDLRIPFIDGFEVIKRIRAAGPNQTKPIIAASAWTDAQTRQNVKDAGAQKFFEKPVNFFNLYRTIFLMVVDHQAKEADGAGGNLTHQQQMIMILQKRLDLLQEKQAIMGIHTPVHIIIEIDEITQDIERLKDK